MNQVRTGRLQRLLPITTWLPAYRASRLRGDGIGALTAWAIVVPESVAYAQIAGVPPQNAFYAAPVALVAYALFGSSRHLVVGATSAAAILSASTVAAVSSDPDRAVALSAALAIIAGVILIAAGLLRLGFVTNFLPEPALVGFLFGMALIIVVRQAGKLVGVSTGEGDFFQRAWHLLTQVDQWSLTTMAVGLGAIAALLLLERLAPRVPASLVVLAAGIALSALLDLERHGVEIVGTIPQALPTPAVPDVSAHEIAGLLGGGFGLALIVFAESFSISSRFARQHGYQVDADQELVGMGTANAAAGLFQGFAVSGSASRTAAVEGAGGSSQMVSLLAAVLVLVTAAFLTPLFTDLPEPVLGAIVIVAVRGFLRVEPLRRYWRLDRRSFWTATTALAGTLVFDLLPGLLIAVALSLIWFIGAASRPRLAVLGNLGAGRFGDLLDHPDAATVPGLLVVRPDGPVFFANANQLRMAVLQLVGTTSPPPRVVVVDLSSSFRLSVPTLDTLSELDDELRQRGIALWLARVRSTARRSIEASGLADRLGPAHLYGAVEDAVHAFTGGNRPLAPPTSTAPGAAPPG
jgi:high affinity sulfate transporter 1